MFESDGDLLTWATDVPSCFEGRLISVATRLANHRLEYLDYEGPVSGDRGNVVRILAGECFLRCQADDEFGFDLEWFDESECRRSATVRLHRNVTLGNRGREAWELEFDLLR